MNRMHAHAHAIMLTILLTSMLSLATNVQPVKESGTIFIRADGSVDPSTAPIQRNGNIYTFTNNINDSIVVERNGVTIEGAGYTIQGTGSGIGINLTARSNLAIKNMEIRGFQYGIYLSESYYINISRNNLTANNWDGIYLSGSSNNTLTGNVITANNGFGIYLSGSSNNTLTGNMLSDNEYNFGVSGISLSHFIHTIDTYNLVNNKPVYYLINKADAVINPETYPYVGYLGLINCVNITIERLSLTNNVNGLLLVYTSNSKIASNSIVNNWDGIYLCGSSNNRINHNNFVNNTIQAHDVSWDYPSHPSSINVWDNGGEGNYWSNYTGVDLNHDGIGDKPHFIYANNTDHYPLMGMFSILNTSFGYHVNLISNSIIENFQYFKPNSTIKMHVSNMTASQSFGFCRVAIPKGLMAPPYTVIIDDGLTEVLYFNDTIYDNDTYRWIYFAYDHSTHKIVITPEFPSLITPLLLMITTLLTVIVHKRTKEGRTRVYGYNNGR